MQMPAQACVHSQARSAQGCSTCYDLVHHSCNTCYLHKSEMVTGPTCNYLNKYQACIIVAALQC
jgi:hypothetical protein